MKDKDFTRSLTKKWPKVFVDLLLRAKKYINTKEAMAIKYQGHDKSAREEKEERYHQRGRSPRHDRDHQQRRRNPRAFPHYAPLRQSRREILLNMEKENLAASPLRMKNVHSEGTKANIATTTKTTTMIPKSASTSRKR